MEGACDNTETTSVLKGYNYMYSHSVTSQVIFSWTAFLYLNIYFNKFLRITLYYSSLTMRLLVKTCDTSCSPIPYKQTPQQEMQPMVEYCTTALVKLKNPIIKGAMAI